MTQPPEPKLYVAVGPDESDLRVQIASTPSLVQHGPILTTEQLIVHVAKWFGARQTTVPHADPVPFVKKG